MAEQVHDRMPVILALKDYDEWLDRGEMERPPVHLLRPFASSGLKVYSAHPKEGNVRNQGLEMLNGE